MRGAKQGFTLLIGTNKYLVLKIEPDDREGIVLS